MNWQELLNLPVTDSDEPRLFLPTKKGEVGIPVSKLNQLAREAGLTGEEELDVLGVLAKVPDDGRRLTRAVAWLSGLIYLIELRLAGRSFDPQQLLPAFRQGQLDVLAAAELALAHQKREKYSDPIEGFFNELFGDVLSETDQ